MTRSCDTLKMCFLSILNQGLRNGGGIGDVMRPPSNTEPLYLVRSDFSSFSLQSVPEIIKKVYLNLYLRYYPVDHFQGELTV